ncbi:hypothetical protein [Urechidicola sp. KH5]
MEFERFRKRKKPNKTRLIILLVALLGVLTIWLNSGAITEWLFKN